MLTKLKPILLLVLLLNGCKTIHIIFPPPVLEHPDQLTNFCDLLNHKSQLVYTRAIYRISKHSWHLYSPDKNCSKVYANLYLSPQIMADKETVEHFRLLKEARPKYYLIIDAVGIFEDDNESENNHHGGLDPNDAHFKFVVKRLTNVQKVLIPKS